MREQVANGDALPDLRREATEKVARATAPGPGGHGNSPGDSRLELIRASYCLIFTDVRLMCLASLSLVLAAQDASAYARP